MGTSKTWTKAAETPGLPGIWLLMSHVGAAARFSVRTPGPLRVGPHPPFFQRPLGSLFLVLRFLFQGTYLASDKLYDLLIYCVEW